MALNGEESSSIARLRRDTGVETETRPTVPFTLEERGGATSSASQFQSSSVLSSLSPGRAWNRVGDFLTGRYESSQGLWSASGTRRQYPMIPAISRFIESNHSPHPAGFDRHSYSSTEDGMHRHNIHLSSRLPRRIWFLLAKALGIKLSHSDRPICATILHVFTLVAAMTFAIPGGWYTIYDIHSEFSKTTVLIGSVQLIIGFGWACMGVYAHNIAGRLFSNKNFVECVRVHSKTFLKISTSWLTLFLGVLVISVNCYEAAPIFYDDTCGTVQIEILVCQVFFVGRVVYAVTSLLWNFIVVYVLFSVCRTHTIGIRRFMRELDFDAKSYEDFCLQQYNIQRNSEGGSPSGSNLEESWFLWDDTVNQDSDDDVTLQYGTFLQSTRCFSNRRELFTCRRLSSRTTQTSDGGEEARNGDDSCGGGNDVGDNGEVFPTPASLKYGASVNGEAPEDDGEENEVKPAQCSGMTSAPNILSNEDLLFSYWKFLRRLCVTSRYLQRWLASWITFVVLWDGYFIIYWTSHKASLVGILQFVVPLLLLLLICSAYAEVNAEGQRLLKMICPMEERLAIIFYFNQQPLTIRVFSFTVTYNAIVTIMLGFSVAFASRMILDEISGN